MIYASNPDLISKNSIDFLIMDGDGHIHFPMAMAAKGRFTLSILPLDISSDVLHWKVSTFCA